MNNKLYIGKTQNSIQDRWKRHIEDAISFRLDTHFARGIRKWGEDSFKIEEIDIAETLEELEFKEKYWIAYYKKIAELYNKTDGGDGGDTYKYKSEEEMAEIKKKISQSKLGGKNPNARKIKCKNINTNKEYHFDSCEDCVKFFNETNHTFITKRCREELKYLYKGEWVFAYEENEYIKDYYSKKHQNRKRKIQVLDLKSNEEKVFDSYTEAKKYYGVDYRLSPHKPGKIGDTFIIHNRFKITILN